MNKLPWLGLCAWLGLSLCPARAAVWYVATNGSDGAAGTSWETAFATIGNALATNAIVAGENHEVWVSNGTYALSAQLYLTKGVRLWGAYGDGQTILDGGDATRCVFITNGVLDGFTVTNGYADSATDNRYGGGVYVVTGQVLNCTVTGNRSYYLGGGIYGKSGGIGVISNCVIAGNRATNTAGYGGGGAYFTGSGWRVLDCPSINDNIALTYAGGVYLTGGGVISNSVLSNNICFVASGTLLYGGGLYVYDRAQAVDCLVASNICDVAGNGRGGGIYVGNTGLVVNCTVRANVAGENGGGLSVSYAIVNNCPEISGNRTYLTGTKRGGGLYLSSGSRVSDCTIRNNTARMGAGISSAGTSDIIVSNCVIADNISNNETGGVEGNNTDMILRNCLITRNVSVYSAGGVYMADGTTSPRTFRVENCTVVSNRCQYAAGGISCSWTNTVINTICYSNLKGSAASNIEVANTGATFTNCCTPTAASLTGANNIPDYPEFADPANGDWRLTADSPCVNAGTNDDWTQAAVDLDGHTRVDRFSRQVDIGAYEFLPAGALFQLR